MTEPQSFHITDLINDVKRGYIKIPQFQRDFIWSKEKAASLMDSILKGYPIGTMILWKTKEALRAIRNLGGVDLPETPSGDFIQYVLDGQQRLTSIFATLIGAVFDVSVSALLLSTFSSTSTFFVTLRIGAVLDVSASSFLCSTFVFVGTSPTGADGGFNSGPSLHAGTKHPMNITLAIIIENFEFILISYILLLKRKTKT